MGCCILEVGSIYGSIYEVGSATSVYDAGETFTGMLYLAINSSVFKMDIKIGKGSETSHSMTYVWKLCLTVKYLNSST